MPAQPAPSEMIAQQPGWPGPAGPPDVTRPLPDPWAIRMRPVPEAVPPYDDEEARCGSRDRGDAFAAAVAEALSQAGRRASAGQGSSAAGPAPAGPGGRAAAHPALARPRARARGCPPEWPGRFAQVLAETLAGARPPAQMVPWTTERARSHIRGLGPLLADGKRPLVQRVVTSLPAPGVMEMSVVVGFGPRVRALAVRLERAAARQGEGDDSAGQARWLCTAVEAA